MPIPDRFPRYTLMGIRWLLIAVVVVAVNGTCFGVMHEFANGDRFKWQVEEAFRRFAGGMWYVLFAVFTWIVVCVAEAYLKCPNARSNSGRLGVPTTGFWSLSWISRIALATIPLLLFASCYDTWVYGENCGWTPHRESILAYLADTIYAGHSLRCTMMLGCLVWVAATVAKKYLEDNSPTPIASPEADYQDPSTPQS